MNRIVYILLAVTIGLSKTSAKVLELNDRFAQVNKQGLWLVMFYAPWCGHCKHLEPTWMEVGQQLAQDSPDVAVSRLDATKYSSLTSQYGVRGFPTIKFFKFGRQFDYDGPRTKESIMSFALRAKGPEIMSLSGPSALRDAQNTHSVFYVYVGDDQSELKQSYKKTASALFTSIDFFSIEKRALPEDIKPKYTPTVLVFKDGTHYEQPSESPSAALIELWIRVEQFSSYSHLTGASYHSLVGAGRPLAVAVVSNDPLFNMTVLSIALQRNLPYTFCWIANNAIANSMTYSTISEPNLLLYDGRTHEYHVFNDDERQEKLNKLNILKFFDDVKSGKIPVKGSRTVWQQVKRGIGEFILSIAGLFQNSPIMAVLVIVVPTVVIMGLCVCLCTITDDGEPMDDVSTDDEADDLLPPSDKSDPENVDPDAEVKELDQDDPNAGGDGLRKRIVTDQTSNE